MRFTKKQLLYILIVVALSLLVSTYQLPYYIYKPGGADALKPIVEVVGGYESQGDMHLVTVRGGQATPVQYVMAKILPYQEILPLEQVRPKGVSDEEYFHAQLQMMESSQQASTVVAYEAAKADIKIEYNGVYVMAVVEGMPAEEVLKMGDRIIAVDNAEIKQSDDLITYIESKKADDIITVHFIRDELEHSETIKLKKFANDENKVGLGIQLVTDRSVTVDPEVKFTSGNIGGPSAGLMFALEIYDQLTEEDFTRGYQIAGTGEVDYEGGVHRIGGVDKKVIAADREGCDIFFAPFENGAADSNYELAKKTAEEIGTKMKIVPVNTFEEALNYLKGLDQKQ